MTDEMAIEAGLLAGGAVKHGFFTRRGGVSEGVYASLNGGVGSRDAPAAVSENRGRIAKRLGVPPDRLLVPFQVHSSDALIVEAPWALDERPRCDALATKVRGLALGVTGADCGVVLLHDPSAAVIGAAHAGWKGALSGVLEATLSAMERLGARRRRIRAALGPTIARDSYEVGPEFVEKFLAQDAGSAAFFARPSGVGRDHFDLPSYIGARLKHAGVEAFEDIALDTYADETRFFSYRRSQHRGEADYGRLVAAIALS